MVGEFWFLRVVTLLLLNRLLLLLLLLARSLAVPVAINRNDGGICNIKALFR